MRQTGLLIGLVFLTAAWAADGYAAKVSPATDECIGCHISISPGIVADWERSRHAETSPGEALKQSGLEKKVSSEKIPEQLLDYAVGCSECHTMNYDKHQDTFEHNGYDVHVVVTPVDCSTCHSQETEQFSRSMMAHAYGNLVHNSLYQDFMKSVNGHQTFADMTTALQPPDDQTTADSCLFCHGTKVEVKGTQTKETEFGEMTFPILSGWPNQGVGRLNPDGSRGSCAACHTRHQFAIETARKPYTCSECHKGPDVPAYKVYDVSKHGNIYNSLKHQWDFKKVPWTVGKDFTTPTCAGCHMSLVVDEEGQMVAQRSHEVGDRLPWRIFGLIYAHPHPTSADVSNIKNKAGLPLPTELTGEPVGEFLIDADEQFKRRKTMQKICLACHGEGWVNGHWARFENTLRTSNAMTLTATQILSSAWKQDLVRGLPHNDNVFDDLIEKMWVEQWLFFANSTRFSSAMCGADYGVFENGRWNLSKNIQEMNDWLQIHTALRKR